MYIHSRRDALCQEVVEILSRSGYTFLGQATSTSATPPDYTEQGTKTFVIGSTDVTPYAVWKWINVTPFNDPNIPVVYDTWDDSVAVDTVVESGTVRVSPYRRGDVNGDGQVNSDDAIHLLRYTLMPGRFPINQDGDMSGDGQVNSDDAIHLLRHTLMPERFPLAPEMDH